VHLNSSPSSAGTIWSNRRSLFGLIIVGIDGPIPFFNRTEKLGMEVNNPVSYVHLFTEESYSVCEDVKFFTRA
jgi:hypothetical protein